ncbi:hypothetical protein N0V90_009122 [Kalmusia sp. IMI 367209]|nr:hypothetical protein N0V90_009122 [Kalmusia sp. IMI 367209]
MRTTTAFTQDAERAESAVDAPNYDYDISMDSPESESFIVRLPTPPTSSVAPSVYEPPFHAPPLPRPRRHPLPPGGPKEASLLFYVDNALDDIGKRVTNKHVTTLYPGELEGYKSFAGYVKDMDASIQIPYLINMTAKTIDTLPQFPPLPRITLTLFAKIDSAFSALLLGRDPETNEPLPGFKDDRGINTTDKVRIKGVVERARIVVTRHLVGEEGEDVVVEHQRQVEKADEGFVKFEGFEDNSDSDEDEEERRRWQTDVGRLFERTLGEMGDMLGGPLIGLVTDEEADMRRQLREDIAALGEQSAASVEEDANP